MDHLLLAKVGFAVSLFVKGGYAVVGGYLVKTGIRYVSDYKTSVANEREVG